MRSHRVLLHHPAWLLDQARRASGRARATRLSRRERLRGCWKANGKGLTCWAGLESGMVAIAAGAAEGDGAGGRPQSLERIGGGGAHMCAPDKQPSGGAARLVLQRRPGLLL